MQLCQQGSKPQKPQKVTRGQPNGTRAHESKLEYLKTRLGLSGLFPSLFILNHGRRKSAYQGNMPRTLNLTLLCRGRTSDCPRVRRESRRRSSTLSLAKVCIFFIQSTTSVLMNVSDWYDIKAPSIFEVRNVGKTLVNRSQGLSVLGCPSFTIRILTSSTYRKRK